MRSTLIVLAASAALCSGAFAAELPYKVPAANTPAVKCEAGVDTADKNLLGQGGVIVSKTPMINPWIDCQHSSGWFVANYDYFATDGSWKQEVDTFVGWRGSSGQWDYGVRGGGYFVDAGPTHVGIANTRAWAGYTYVINALWKIRGYTALDYEYAWTGFPGVDPSAVDWQLGATVFYQLTPTVTLFNTVETWVLLNKGFFTSSSPNFKEIVGLRWEFKKNLFLNATYTGMQGNQFDRLDHSWKNMGTLGVSFKFNAF